MNLAFEDCVVLDRILETTDADWQDVFRQFENEQLVNANAIADMALEMQRKKSGSDNGDED